MPRWTVLVALASVMGAIAAACGSNAVGVDTCKTIEDARCNQLPNCPNVQVSPPIWYTSGTAVEACVRYYDTACLHGLSGTNPSNADVSACVAAINANGCNVVAAPETDPACTWLVPPVVVVDAGDGGDAEDGDGSDDADDGG